MTRWFQDGLEGRSFKGTLRLYLVGLIILAPVALVIGFVFGSQALFKITPLLIAILVTAQYGLYYLIKDSESGNALLRYIQMFPTSELFQVPVYSAKSKHARAMNVFICYSSTDRRKVRNLYHRLLSTGINPWLDEEKLLPGVEWDKEIEKAVRASDIVIVCLSQRAMGKSGYLQKEIKYALDIAKERAEQNLFLIPVRLEECEIPDPLRRWQWVNFYEDRGYAQLLQSLQLRAHELGLNFERTQ